MKTQSLKSMILSNLNQIPGWKTDRRIIVFESDDWGSIRMPSSEVYKDLAAQGLNIGDFYNRYDSLATASDLEALFDVLSSIKDQYGRNPAITANCLVANPDFEKIRKDDFKKYHFVLLPDTLKNSKGCENSFKLWKEGIEKGIFIPQFHGREHLNISLWMKALSDHHNETRIAFDLGFWGQQTDYKFAKRKHFLAAYDHESEDQLLDIINIIRNGISIFEKLFGYKPKSFIAPNYIWNSGIERTFHEEGTSYIQTQRKQLIPIRERNEYKTIPHFTGQINEFQQIYFMRNASFEPSSDFKTDWIAECLRGISRAFWWRKPAIISTHRVNYIGSIEPINRARNLKLFKQLLKEIIRIWPGVEFLTSDILGDLIAN